MQVVRIVAPNGSTQQIEVTSEFINTGNVNMMKLLEAHKLDPNELFDQGNTILFIESKNGVETILHTFKKWWS